MNEINELNKPNEPETSAVTKDNGETPSGKKGRGVVIALVVILLLIAGGIAIYFLVRKPADTPEGIAQKILDASAKQDWKTVIDMTPDEVLELLLSADQELLQKKGLTSAGEIRKWALEHAEEIKDPTNGNEVRNPKVDEVVAISPEEYLDLFLAGEDDNTIYPFLKSKDEIAIVKISYIMVDKDNNKELDRKDTVVEYRKGGTWYPMTGLQVIYLMFQYID